MSASFSDASTIMLAVTDVNEDGYVLDADRRTISSKT
jgi:hypothetical protein